ncbi:MAG: hypothetical protein IKU72_03770 [Oscillospiraceae bacterium]|nr:hypothetical protein [Oscillospiraceae bacterium]
MYYVEKLSQEQIASRLFFSRSTVSNLLKRCEDENVVEFKINDDIQSQKTLQSIISDLYGLKTVVIVPTKPNEADRQQAITEAAARYLNRVVENNMTIGIGWGTAINHISNLFPQSSSVYNCKIVQLMGSVRSSMSDIHVYMMLNKLAEQLHGEYYPLLVPLIVHDKSLHDTLLSDPSVEPVFSFHKKLDISVVSLGMSSQDMSNILKSKCLSQEELEYAEMNGAKANLCGYFLDHNGKPYLSEINQRVMAIDLDILKKCPERIGVAWGNDKIQTTTILKSGYITTLIIDEESALSMLRFN